MSSSVKILVSVALVAVPLITGASFTASTVIVALPCRRPAPSRFGFEACTVRLPLPLKFALGVNFSPALPSATVMKLPSVIWVGAVALVERAVGDAGNLEMRHPRRRRPGCAISPGRCSTACLRWSSQLSPRGVSATALTVIARVSVSVSTPPPAVPPLSCTVQARMPLP